MAQQTYNEPVWGTTPQPTFCVISYLHAFGIMPFIMLGVLTNLLRYQFMSTDNLASPYMKHLIWAADPETTKITIIPGMDTDLNHVSANPRIHIILDPTKTRRVGALTGDSTPLAANEHGYVGRRDYNKYLTAGARIICLSQVESESQLMCEEVFSRMLVYAPKIREDIGVGMFKVDGMYPPKSKTDREAGVKVFYSTVQVSWETLYKWSLVAEAPTIKRLYQQHTVSV